MPDNRLQTHSITSRISDRLAWEFTQKDYKWCLIVLGSGLFLSCYLRNPSRI